MKYLLLAADKTFQFEETSLAGLHVGNLGCISFCMFWLLFILLRTFLTFYFRFRIMIICGIIAFTLCYMKYLYLYNILGTL
jgi:hypothetical protein